MLAPGQSLRACGLNSFSAITLLARIETAYGVSIPVSLLTFETFETPAVLWAAIARARDTPAGEQGGVSP